jgi:hypothetical protein
MRVVPVQLNATLHAGDALTAVTEGGKTTATSPTIRVYPREISQRRFDDRRRPTRQIANVMLSDEPPIESTKPV